MRHVLLLCVLIACSSNEKSVALTGGGEGSGSAREQPPPPPIGQAPDPAPYAAAPYQLVDASVVPGAVDWSHRVLELPELAAVLKRSPPFPAGRYVIEAGSGSFNPWDAKTKSVEVVAPGLLGINIKPPVSFGDPEILRGEMPLGGHPRLHTGYLRARASIPTAQLAQPIVDASREDPPRVQLLIELTGETVVDEVRVIEAKLHGVRVIRQEAHDVWLEGTPAPELPGRAP